jgi:uncharacterized protein
LDHGIIEKSIMTEMIDMAIQLSRNHEIPPVLEFYFQALNTGEKHAHARFMVMLLDGGAAGISYLLFPSEFEQKYNKLRSESFTGKSPQGILSGYSDNGTAGYDPVDAMIILTAVNAICQQVMRENPSTLDLATDSLGLMDIRDGDRVGMVGFFSPLMKYLKNVRAELIILEKDESMLKKNKNLPITLDPSSLNRCNKVICTSTTILNNTLDEVLVHCRSAKHIAVLGPTAGFYPDPLFRRGVNVLGGRYVTDGSLMLSRIKAGLKWGDSTEKLCFQRDSYKSILKKS